MEPRNEYRSARLNALLPLPSKLSISLGPLAGRYRHVPVSGCTLWIHPARSLMAGSRLYGDFMKVYSINL